MIQRLLIPGVLLTAALSLAPPRASAASKEIQELQRDVAQLQDMVRAMQRSQDEKFAMLQTLVQQSLNAANDAGKSAAVIQNGFQSNLRELESKVVAPVVGLGTRMDQVSNEMKSMQQAVGDLAETITKLKAQLNDLETAVKLVGQPAIAPPGPSSAGGASASTPSGGGPAPGPTPSSTKPAMSSTELMANANRDRISGKLDLALQGYADYVQWFGNTDMAPIAQYWIGSIYYSQGDYENASKAFDVVLEHYSDNSKTPEAMFYKGMALYRLNRKTDAAREFQDLIKRFPRNDLRPKACDQLKTLGMGCPTARAEAPSKGAAKRNNRK